MTGKKKKGIEKENERETGRENKREFESLSQIYDHIHRTQTQMQRSSLGDCIGLQVTRAVEYKVLVFTRRP